jgi:sialate O-acetylesterase
LTYDDALPVHYEYAAPALEARGLLGTFYLLISGDPMKNFDRWKTLAARGHELGNHSLFHPCRREPPENYPWLDEGFDLRDYTPYRFTLELRVANFFLHLLDGRHARTYGNTCCDTYIGQGDTKRAMDDLLAEDFIAARGAHTNKMVLVSESLNLLNVGHCIADFRHFEELRDEVRAVRKAGAWIVYLVHGVGAESKEIYIERDVHERLLDFLVGEQDVWTRPFIEVASWIRRWREGQPAT